MHSACSAHRSASMLSGAIPNLNLTAACPRIDSKLCYDDPQCAECKQGYYREESGACKQVGWRGTGGPLEQACLVLHELTRGQS